MSDPEDQAAKELAALEAEQRMILRERSQREPLIAMSQPEDQQAGWRRELHEPAARRAALGAEQGLLRERDAREPLVVMSDRKDQAAGWRRELHEPAARRAALATEQKDRREEQDRRRFESEQLQFEQYAMDQHQDQLEREETAYWLQQQRRLLLPPPLGNQAWLAIGEAYINGVDGLYERQQQAEPEVGRQERRGEPRRYGGSDESPSR